MTVNNQYPVLDGIAPSWADIVVKTTGTGLALLDMADIKSINTGTTVEVGDQIGASGGRVLKRTAGSVKSTATWTLYRSGYQKLLRNLMVAAPRRGNQALISLVHFQIQVQHTPPADVEIYEYRMKGCRLGGRNLNGQEGNEADVVEVPLLVIEIADIIDGVEVVML
jgi:hypothetical protein